MDKFSIFDRQLRYLPSSFTDANGRSETYISATA